MFCGRPKFSCQKFSQHVQVDTERSLNLLVKEPNLEDFSVRIRNKYKDSVRSLARSSCLVWCAAWPIYEKGLQGVLPGIWSGEANRYQATGGSALVCMYLARQEGF